MSEIAIRHDGALAPMRTGQDDAVARLAKWAEGAQAAHQMSVSLVQTSFVPQQYRGKPEEATAAILAGAEVGLSPMAALRAFDNIQGTPAPKALTLRAIVQSQGHEVTITESTETRAVVEGRRKGDSRWQKSVWTIDRAAKLGLTGKQQWKQQPGAMLVARATAEVCRWLASDAIMGMPYAAEELSDDVEPSITDAPTARPARRTAQRRPIQAVPDTPEPSLDEPEPQPAHPRDLDAEPEPDARMVTEPQKRHIFALLNDRGITDRDKRLAGISKVVGRQVGSTNELTVDEAARVIESLQPTDEPTLDDQEPAA